MIQCESFFRYIRYILTKIGFFLSQCGCFKISFRVFFFFFFLLLLNLIERFG